MQNVKNDTGIVALHSYGLLPMEKTIPVSLPTFLHVTSNGKNNTGIAAQHSSCLLEMEKTIPVSLPDILTAYFQRKK
jgi:hypothetical protein